MRILIVTPIASHPQNQGNSARIYAIGRQMQSLGHIVHFLYYPLEGLTTTQKRDMGACWDFFHTMPCDLQSTKKSLGNYFGIDDWYDPQLGEFVKKLHERWSFDLVWVNYVWFSGLLDCLPETIHKVIDTHDVFGDRHLRFIEVGLEPEWFYTTKEQERIGLSRAHTIVAIQDEEEAYFKTQLVRSKSNVITIGHVSPPRFMPERNCESRTVIGYLGSGNPFNVSSLKAFAQKIAEHTEMLKRFRFVLAGSICDQIKELKPFEILGRIDELDDFYRNVDIVINPMNSGTGLKIKTLEAMSFGKPFLGTESAFVGISKVKVKSEGENDLQLLTIALSPSLTSLTAADSRSTFVAYISRQASCLKKTLEEIATRVD